ncbi:putative AbiEii toxin of type IV toxin-antitoxin system [Micromonospora kangleipakensis]|uniref:Putative AbiEii toxin of type IV toxin-antitoxin system n=1 Tax=Micromonospora kangleipakensis TaxID=1077942 RepID=A0A4Q8B3E9_9ACTN|nr:AAA family ATPase [Micromonospora kangleipakensis]RZU72007.1 putative AbiEii toxin of type IV toxin-antitoxin system [Micromonospora kangleipakensis]
MKFYVIEDYRSTPSALEYPAGLLYWDNWDDYGFKTTYTLLIALDRNRLTEIGAVKILKDSQTSGATPMPASPFNELGDSYCSLGQSLSYYQTLKQLGDRYYPAILTGLRDIVYEPGIAEPFLAHRGFKDSLERFGSSVRAISDAAPLFRATTTSTAGEAVSIRFQTSVGGNQFQVPLVFNEVPEIPGRINALIGYNGSGKTRLLANLAQVAHAGLKTRGEADFVSENGAFVESHDFRFSSVIAVSYSAFDTFDVPGGHEEEREQLGRRGEIFGYVYAGLRSFAEDDADNDESDDGSPEGDKPDRLKSIQEITEDFEAALAATRHPSRGEPLKDVLANVLNESSFLRLGVDLHSIHDPNFVPDVFTRLSTGHKIVLNIAVQLVAHLGLRSLVLIDEPESHLHPPLLAALLRGINTALDIYDSYGVIATHSPVVLQEVPRRYVTIMRRFDSVTVVERPTEETFGENVGFLTKNVFNLNTSATDHHSILRELAQSHTLTEIEELFGNPLSLPARAYIENVRRSIG